MWSTRYHIICHTSRKTNHLCSTTLFSQDTECNAKSQPRYTDTGYNRPGIALATNIFLFRLLFLLLFRPLALLLSRSLALSLYSLGLLRSLLLHLCLYLSLSVAQTVPLFLSLSLSLYVCCPSLPLAFSLCLTQSLTHSIRRRRENIAKIS